MIKIIKIIIILTIFACSHPASAGSPGIPVPSGFEPPSGPVYHLFSQRDMEWNDPEDPGGGGTGDGDPGGENPGDGWLFGKTVLYTSKTPDAFFAVFSDGSALHCIRDWEDSDLGDMGFWGEGDWSALVAAGTGGLMNGLLMDLQDVGYESFYVLDWMLRAPTTPVPWESPKGPIYRIVPKDKKTHIESPQKRSWVMDKEVSYLRYSGRYDLIVLVFKDDSLIRCEGPNYLGMDPAAWRGGLGADWQALVTMGAMAMGTSRRVNILVEGDEVVSWTLH